MMIKMDDEKLWTDLLAHQEANIEERPEVVMLQLSGDYLSICLLVNHILSLFNMYQNLFNSWMLPLNLVQGGRGGSVKVG